MKIVIQYGYRPYYKLEKRFKNFTVLHLLLVSSPEMFAVFDKSARVDGLEVNPVFEVWSENLLLQVKE